MRPETVGFILSTARTGTKALAEGLAGPDVQSPHQPPFSRLLTVTGNFVLHGRMPRSVFERLVRIIRIRQIEAGKCRVYVQVFSLDYMAAEVVSRVYGDVRIAHIVRDPRTFVPSYMNWMRGRAASYVANKWVPSWHPSGYLTGEYSRLEWRAMDELQRVCWHWSFKNRLIRDTLGRGPHYRCVRFEDLFMGEDRRSVLQDLVGFLDIPFREEQTAIYRQAKNASRKGYCPSWTEWSTRRQEQLIELCAAEMVRYGYLPDEQD